MPRCVLGAGAVVLADIVVTLRARHGYAVADEENPGRPPTPLYPELPQIDSGRWEIDPMVIPA